MTSSFTRPDKVSLSSQKSINSSSDDSEPPPDERHFDGRAPLDLGGGRLYDLLELRCFNHMPGFEQSYRVEVEAQERSTQNSTFIRVILHWEETYEHNAPPSEKVLLKLARSVITHYFTENRFTPRFSAINRPVVLHWPAAKPNVHY